MIDTALRMLGMRTRAGLTGRTERPAAWYDAVYAESKAYRMDPARVSWRAIWDAAIDRVPRGASVVDLGCGVGQFAELLARRRPDITAYQGFDFSRVAVRHAKARRLPSRYTFADRPIESVAIPEGSVVVCLEVIEHLRREDLPIRRTPLGSLFIGSVPNYDASSHVRTYDEQDVRDRLGKYLRDFEVVTVPVARVKQAYVFSGTRSAFRHQ